MEQLKLPHAIKKHTKDMTFTKNQIGCSSALVYHIKNNDREFYLKIDKSNPQFKHEQNIMRWLQSKLPVPRIMARCEKGGHEYLLMTKMPGVMACSDEYINKPEELVKLLAQGIETLQAVKISGCPYIFTVKNKLKLAKKRIENHQVDMSDWEDRTQFQSPEDLFDYLVANQPEEELIFSHGDYCLPNIFLRNNQVSGYIDLGRSGIADKWQDIALCFRSLIHNLKSNQYTDLLFECLNLEPDYKKIQYFILLDELF